MNPLLSTSALHIIDIFGTLSHILARFFQAFYKALSEILCVCHDSLHAQTKRSAASKFRRDNWEDFREALEAIFSKTDLD